MARPTDDRIRKEIFGKIQTQELDFEDIILQLERTPNLSVEIELSATRSEFEIKEGVNKKTNKPAHILFAKMYHVHRIDNWREPAVFPFDDLWVTIQRFTGKTFDPKGVSIFYRYDLKVGIGAEPYHLIFTNLRMQDKATFEAFLKWFRELATTHPGSFAYTEEKE
jgi:hypothetical protein